MRFPTNILPPTAKIPKAMLGSGTLAATEYFPLPMRNVWLSVSKPPPPT
nr:hypothetical protein [Plectonema radiosum]